MHCPEQCGEWSENHGVDMEDEDHELVDAGHCVAVRWFEDVGCVWETSDNEAGVTVSHGQLVSVSWNGDGWVWELV